MIKQRSKSKILMNQSFTIERKQREVEEVKTLKKVLSLPKNIFSRIFYLIRI